MHCVISRRRIKCFQTRRIASNHPMLGYAFYTFRFPWALYTDHPQSAMLKLRCKAHGAFSRFHNFHADVTPPSETPSPFPPGYSRPPLQQDSSVPAAVPIVPSMCPDSAMLSQPEASRCAQLPIGNAQETFSVAHSSESFGGIGGIQGEHWTEWQQENGWDQLLSQVGMNYY
jgi:hypothetical protein